MHRHDHDHAMCEHPCWTLGPKVTVDSLVAKYNAPLKKASDSSTRLQRLLVVAETLLPQLKRKDPQVFKELSAAVSTSRALMLELLEKTTDLKSCRKTGTARRPWKRQWRH